MTYVGKSGKCSHKDCPSYDHCEYTYVEQNIPRLDIWEIYARLKGEKCAVRQRGCWWRANC